ncbi:hypothetical protein B0H11DRAFT_1917643 [Mycena galericulata]|nr:hypothetical protein B0H11DRAFT_1917643 [Mycena galericulata]
MSRYLDGDDARENPLPLQAFQREGSDGGEHGSGAFDVMSARDVDECVIALRQAKAQVEVELKQAVAESKLTTDQSNSSGRVPAGRPKGKKAEKKIDNATSESNVEQVPRVSDFFQFPILGLFLIATTPSVRLSVSQLRVTAQRNHQSTISEDEHDDVQREKEGQTLRTGDEASGPRRLRSRGANVSFTTSRTAPSAAKHKSALTAALPAPKPKRCKAGDPLAGRAIELVPGDKTTAISPREYAQKEPEEFAAQYYPQHVKFL